MEKRARNNKVVAILAVQAITLTPKDQAGTLWDGPNTCTG